MTRPPTPPRPDPIKANGASSANGAQNTSDALLHAFWQKALSHAPDATEQWADAATRQRIFAAAHEATLAEADVDVDALQAAGSAATTTATTVPRNLRPAGLCRRAWDWFWHGAWASSSRAQWGAGLATVVLGVWVLLLWLDKPLPQTEPMASVEIRSEVAEPAAFSSSSAPALEPQPAPEIAPEPAPESAQDTSQAASQAAAAGSAAEAISMHEAAPASAFRTKPGAEVKSGSVPASATATEPAPPPAPAPEPLALPVPPAPAMSSHAAIAARKAPSAIAEAASDAAHPEIPPAEKPAEKTPQTAQPLDAQVRVDRARQSRPLAQNPQTPAPVNAKAAAQTALQNWQALHLQQSTPVRQKWVSRAQADAWPQWLQSQFAQAQAVAKLATDANGPWLTLRLHHHGELVVRVYATQVQWHWQAVGGESALWQSTLGADAYDSWQMLAQKSLQNGKK